MPLNVNERVKLCSRVGGLPLHTDVGERCFTQKQSWQDELKITGCGWFRLLETRYQSAVRGVKCRKTAVCIGNHTETRHVGHIDIRRRLYAFFINLPDHELNGECVWSRDVTIPNIVAVDSDTMTCPRFSMANSIPLQQNNKYHLLHHALLYLTYLNIQKNSSLQVINKKKILITL